MKNKKLFFVTLFSFVFILFSQHSSSQTLILTSESGSYENFTTYDYVISDIKTVADAADVTAYFKTKFGITDATIDLAAHKLSVIAENTVQTADIEEIIHFLGKIILYDPKEITKYYPD